MSITNRVPLKSIASFSKGEQINGDLLLKDGTYPYLNGGINPSGMWDEYNVAADTVTISEGGNSCGYVNYMNTPFWCGAHCYYLFDVKCDVKFLYHALKSSQNKLMSLRSGACMPNIKKKDLGEFEIPEPPPLEIQREIAYNLDKAAEAADICRKILEKFDFLVQAKFTEMFGDITETVPLSDIASYFNGLTYKPENFKAEGTAVLRSGNIQNSELDFQDLVRVDCQVKDKLFPPKEKVSEFAEFLNKTDLAKSAAKKALERAGTLKSALMQKYFG